MRAITATCAGCARRGMGRNTPFRPVKMRQKLEKISKTLKLRYSLPQQLDNISKVPVHLPWAFTSRKSWRHCLY